MSLFDVESEEPTIGPSGKGLRYVKLRLSCQSAGVLKCYSFVDPKLLLNDKTTLYSMKKPHFDTSPMDSF